MKRGFVGLLVVALAFSFGLVHNVKVQSDNSGSLFFPVNSYRLFDSRTSTVPGHRLGPNQQLTIQSGYPGAAAVAANITLTDTTGPGFIAVWPTGPWPGTSSVNSSASNQSIANYVIIPVALDGTFQLLVQSQANVIVDIMGYFSFTSSVQNPISNTGVSATITGYSPGYSITSVIGTVTNNTSFVKDVRVDVRCPNGNVEIDSFFDLPVGATKGFSVICSGVFSDGATASIVDI